MKETYFANQADEYIIGFTNEFYTLWIESIDLGGRQDIYPEYYPDGTPKDGPKYYFLQNLSKDYDEAIAKADEMLGKANYSINLDQRGRFTWDRQKKLNAPDDVFAFGKYRGKSLYDVNDLNYFLWYFEQTNNMIAEYFLLAAGYRYWTFKNKAYDAVKEKEILREVTKLIDPERYAQLKKRDELEKKKIKGHHFSDGEKVELNVTKLFSTYYDGFYGTVYIIGLIDDLSRVYTYKGANPPLIETGETVAIRATIKHGEYKEEKQTLLQRIRVLKTIEPSAGFVTTPTGSVLEVKND